ncbi:glycosyltransferase [Nitrospira sp. T9]|uniref:glycosyltransferase n=1 Tax=unclassified Nitrospira TaxID=2652172 RepID=UPI003F9E32D6
MNSPPPFFSIVIPTYNRPKQLALCLHSINGLTYPRERFEVIVVDDGSHTSLDSIVKSFSGPLAIKLISQPNSGPGVARNRGAADAQGDFLAFTDDDCSPSSSWLHALADAFRDTPDCGVGGRTVNKLTDNLYSATSQLLLDYLYEYFNQDLKGTKFFASNNLAFPRKRFLESGGFDAQYRQAAAEDRELCDRWISQGRRLRYLPEALVSHAHSLGLGTIWQQHFNYGRGAFFFHRMRAARGGGPVRVEPLSFYLNMFRYPFTYISLKRAMPISFLLLITQVANASGYFWEMVRNRTG